MMIDMNRKPDYIVSETIPGPLAPCYDDGIRFYDQAMDGWREMTKGCHPDALVSAFQLVQYRVAGQPYTRLTVSGWIGGQA